MLKKYKKYFNFGFFLIFILLLIVSYNSSKRKPDSVGELITDPRWLNNFPKWLDVPFMVWINDGWRAFSAKYGLIFDAIGYGLLRSYSIIKNFLVDVPWPIIVLAVVLLTFYASGKKYGTTLFVGLCTFSIGFLNPRFWDKAIETTTIVFIGIVLCVIVGIPIGIAMARSPKVRQTILPILDLMQVIPAFCYLIPGIILFGLGAIPAIIGIFILKASFIANFSQFVSIINIKSGILFISAIPPRDLSSLSLLIPIFKISFFVKPLFSVLSSS